MSIQIDPREFLSEEEARAATELCERLVAVLQHYEPHIGARAMASLMGCNALHAAQTGDDDLSTVLNRFTSFITSAAEVAVDGQERRQVTSH